MDKLFDIEPENSNFASAQIEYLQTKQKKDITNVHLCYNELAKQYFVSRFFSKEYIESIKGVKVVQ